MNKDEILKSVSNKRYPHDLIITESRIFKAMEIYSLQQKIELMEQFHKDTQNTNAIFRSALRLNIELHQNQLQKLKG